MFLAAYSCRADSKCNPADASCNPLLVAALYSRLPVIKNLYAIDTSNNSVRAFRVDHATGRVGLLQTYMLGAAPGTLTAGGSCVFVGQTGSALMLTARMDDAGSLTQAQATQNLAIANFNDIQYANGSVFISVAGSAYSFRVGSNCTLQQNGSLANVNGANYVRIHPGNRLLYTSNSATNDVSVCSINGDGTLPTTCPNYLTNGAPEEIAFTGDGTKMFTALPVIDRVNLQAVDSQGVVATGTPVLTGGTGPRAVAVDPVGRFAYTAHLTTANVSGFQISGTSLSAVPGSPLTIAGLLSAGRLVVDPQGKYLYVMQGTSLLVLGINQSNGSLSTIQDFTLTTSPVRLVMTTQDIY